VSTPLSSSFVPLHENTRLELILFTSAGFPLTSLVNKLPVGVDSESNFKEQSLLIRCLASELGSLKLPPLGGGASLELIFTVRIASSLVILSCFVHSITNL